MKKMPETIYVTTMQEGKEDEYFVVHRSLEALLSQIDDDGEAVGVYELKNVQKVEIRKALKDR